MPIACTYAMDPAVDCSLQRGARVRLIGLSTQILNGAEGRIVDKPDASTGRFPVRLVSPQEAVAAYRDGVKVRPQNLVPLADAPLEQQAPHDEEDEEEHAEEHEKVEGADCKSRGSFRWRVLLKAGAWTPRDRARLYSPATARRKDGYSI